ncbi:Elongator complex protein [Phytophthora megakarya]|uniref:Elongator complex protein 4 n=1 Tax=Phytophthora megakarya TaxID=4795 RepID=A0A225VAV8_9STRA|nr:Elongator complex protein [Phytophthora megakarya]
MSRTAVNMQNAHTQFASIITTLIVILSLYTLTGTLYYLPRATLASIIIVAGYTLVEFKEAKWLYRVKRDEFFVWTASFILTLGLGVLEGLIASIICSVLALMIKTKRSPVVILGELDNGSLVDRDLFTEATDLNDIIVIRTESSLYFANCERVALTIEREMARLLKQGVTTHGVVLDASQMNDLDATTIQVLSDTQEKLEVRKVLFAIANAKGRLHDILATTNLPKRILGGDPRVSVEDAVRMLRSLPPSGSTTPPSMGATNVPVTLNLVETCPPDEPSSLNVGAAASDALAVDLLRYFVAEGVADGNQRVAIVAPDAAEFVQEQLPLELSRAQRQVKEKLAETKDTTLTIAWQYGKYNDKRTEKSRFCHSFDLSKKMHSEMLTANEPVAIDPLVWMENTSVSDVYERLYCVIEELVHEKAGDKSQVLRVGVLGLGSPLLGPPDAVHMTALFTFVRRLRVLISESKSALCLAVLSSEVLSAFPTSFVNELRHVSDSVLTLNSFAGTRDLLPEELHEFQGSLTLRKLPRVHALACHAPSNTRFGVKRDRRKLKIEKFHLPPEGSRSGNSSSCGSTPSTTHSNDPLAF